MPLQPYRHRLPPAMTRRSLAGWLLFLLATLGLAAATPLMETGRPYFRAHLVRHGLPQSTVMSLTFDARGVLWVGTQDGAGTYDGSRWTTVNMPERRVSNYVESVLPASDGSVWFGRQDGGIARLAQDGTWTRFGSESLPSSRVTCLAEVPGPDGKPVIWAGTYGGGLARYAQGRWSLFEDRPGRPYPRLWKLIPSQQPDHPGDLWVCGEGGTLARISPAGALQSYPGLPPVSINHLLESRDDQGRPELWASTFGGGIAHFQEGRWRFVTTQQGLPSNFTTDVAETWTPWGTRVLWFASVGGLTRLENGRMRTFTARSGLGTDAIYRLHRDPQRPDSLWIGTLGGGLLHFREGGWLTHDALAGVPGNFILSLAQGRPVAGETTVLAGTSLGIARFQAGRWADIPLPAGHASTRINALLESRRGGRPVLWAGTLAGLLRLESGQWTQFGEKSGLPGNAVSVLMEGHDADGAEVLWAGTQNGALAWWDGNRWRTLEHDARLPRDYVLSLAESRDPDGSWTLWAGFRNGGLRRWKAGQWTFWDRENGLPNNSVQTIHLSKDAGGRSRIFIGTLGGGVAWSWTDGSELSWNRLSSEGAPPLPNDSIQGILEDRKGRIYLCTNRGVIRLTPTGAATFDLRHFLEQDGLPGPQCSPNCNLLDAEGRIWVGTTLGLAELDIRVDPPSPMLGRIQLREVRAGGTAILPIPPGGGTLVHPVRDVDLAFSLVDHHSGSGIQYRTQLIGHDEQPTPWTNEGRRSFTNLPFGSYVFRIWAKDALNREAAPLEWTVNVPPAPWETLWFRGLILLLGGLGVLLLVRWRLGSVHRRAAELERLVSQRTVALAETNLQLTQEIRERVAAEKVKEEFVSVVSHELRTPLTSIRGALGLMDGGVVGGLQAQAVELIRIAHANALRLMALVNDLLDIQRLEADQVNLQTEPLDLRAMVARMLEAHQGLAQTFGTGFQVRNSPVAVIVQADARRIEQVMGNLLANACKFSNRGSEVEVALTAEGPVARISVTNHGPMIPDEFRPRIFSKFAQADASSSRPAGGTGLGLAISKVLVEAHGGRIGFESSLAATTFWFELPLPVAGGVPPTA